MFGGGFDNAGAHGLEKANIIPDGQNFLIRHGQRKGLRQARDGLQEALLAVIQPEDMILGPIHQDKLLFANAVFPLGIIKAME